MCNMRACLYYTVYFFPCLLVIVFSASNETTAKLRFYHSCVDNFTEVPLEDAYDILLSNWFDCDQETVIFAHGYKGQPNGPAVTAIINTYLSLGNNNVALLNWEEMAADKGNNLAGSYLNWAAPNARKLGAIFAGALLNLSSAGLDLNKVHLVGHSLGAHLIGIAGNILMEKGIQLPWITGLDPASMNFEGRPLASKLNPKSGGYVDVIHSDPNKYGHRKPLGTVDFWPNFRTVGPVTQPGCIHKVPYLFTQEDLCNHNRCWQLLVDSIKYPGSVIASYAKNYRTWKNYSKEEKNVTLEVGKYYKNVLPGNYYFVTKADSPLGLGLYGL